MHVTNKLFALPRIIALAGGLLVASPAFASITDLDVSNVDLQPTRTEVTMTVTGACPATNTNYATVTVSIYQNQGRLVVIGTKTTTFQCTGGATNFSQNISVTVPPNPQNGGLKFQPGPATLYASGDETDVNGTPINGNTTFEFGERVNLH